ncbi:MAG: murein L,D-transpeptidase catalytic domain family protein [Chitinophagaceae bacterium]
MKQLFILVCSLFLVLTTIPKAHATFLAENESSITQNKTERYIHYVYDNIKFPKNGKLRYEVFRNGFFGYMNLKEARKIKQDALLTICDFTLSSNKKRLWVIDVNKKRVLFHTLVAHGSGTGEEFATSFSNINDSHQSSLGFYCTGETYQGNNGYSLKLHGVDGMYNSNAYDRAIVIHGAAYVSDEFAKANQRLGRSHGCPALPVDLAPKIIDQIKFGSCLFIYHTSSNYLKRSQWLNSPLRMLPNEANLMDLKMKTNSSRSSEVNEEKPSKTEKIEDEVDTEKDNETPYEADKSATKQKEHFDINKYVSAEEQANFNIEVKTIKLEKPITSTKTDLSNIDQSKVKRIVRINEATGISDTIIIK